MQKKLLILISFFSYSLINCDDITINLYNSFDKELKGYLSYAQSLSSGYKEQLDKLGIFNEDTGFTIKTGENKFSKITTLTIPRSSNNKGEKGVIQLNLKEGREGNPATLIDFSLLGGPTKEIYFLLRPNKDDQKFVMVVNKTENQFKDLLFQNR